MSDAKRQRIASRRVGVVGFGKLGQYLGTLGFYHNHRAQRVYWCHGPPRQKKQL